MTANPNQHWGGRNHTSVSRFLTSIVGVVFDSNLSFNDHIITTASSCMSALGQISRVKHIFRKDILVTIINSLAFSKLYYCSSV